MSEMQGKQRSAVVFGARNLGRAVIELLVTGGWAVAGVARSQSTLDGVSAAGALALKADVAAQLPRPTQAPLTRGQRLRRALPSRSCPPVDDSRSPRAGQRLSCRSPAA